MENMISVVTGKISIPEALAVSGISMALIMCVLALLMGFIYAFSAIMKKAEAKGFSLGKYIKSIFTKKSNEIIVEEKVAPLNASPIAPGSAGDIMLHDVDPKVAAMLMAIVADELKTPVNELHFISIKEIKEN